MYSQDQKRNKAYVAFISTCQEKGATVHDIIQLGTRLMKQSKLHHHFFGDYSLLNTAQYITHFVLDNKKKDSDHITVEEAQKVLPLLERRIAERIPVEYLTHEAFYLDRQFYVNEHVLVPRSVMNTRFHDFLESAAWSNYRILDLCAGSGCIGITLALMNENLQVDLADISPEALEVANINIKKFSLEDRVHCLQSDLFENIVDKYDLIITNPPYVSAKDYQKSPEEFHSEPKIALEAGKDGLNVIHRIIQEAKQYLTPKGRLIAEIGCPAAKRIKKQYPKISFTWYKYRKPNGKVSWFISPCIFECKAAELPD